ncbi:MAG: protein-tyrosine kinase [Acidobacteriaceae bacterium]|jgi:capsular exopolysaccharide synthesis family protein|nr:protein-tyrosine kinase [Acidobacteriaceae bacterium]
MSVIFDALQRSEAERSGLALSALSAVTEVLQRAELHATSDRETASLVQQPVGAKSEQNGASLQSSVVADVTTIEPPPNDTHSTVFGPFERLQSVTPPAARLVCYTDAESLAAEKFRFLGVSLQLLRRDRVLKKVLITSTIPQEGKSMVSANLACSLARTTQQKILLIEGDVRRPALSRTFGLETLPGISECLKRERALTSCIYHLEGPGLWFLPAGSAPKNPLEILQSERLSPIMEQLAIWFDWIIIDSPPVMPLADTSVWMRLVDGVLVVVRQGITEKRQLERGIDALEPKKIIGAVLNGSKRQAKSDYYYSKA